MSRRLLVLICGIAMSFLVGLPSMAQLDGSGNAPDFILTDIEGKEHHLYEYLDSGKVVIIDFFAVWCSICQSNTTVLESVYQKYGPDGSDRIEMLSLEADNLTTDQAAANFAQAFHSENPIINTTLDVSTRYKIPGFPIYYVVAPDRSYQYFPGIEMNLEDALSEAIESSPGLRFIDNDARIINFTNPRGTYCQVEISPMVELQNYGKNNITDLELLLELDGEAAYSMKISQLIKPYEFLELMMPELENIENGWHDVAFSITSVNFIEDAELNDGFSSGSFLYLEEGESVEIRLSTDNYPAETYWQIFEDGKLASERLIFAKAKTMYLDTICLEPRHCYDLVLSDRFGDGLSEGGIEVLYEGKVIASMASDIFNGRSSELNFCLNTESSGRDHNLQNTIQLDVFPNPSSGIVTIDFRDEQAGFGKLELLNIAGQQILSESNVDFTSKKTINLSSYPDGIFFLRITKTDQIITKKILIQK